MALGGRSAVHPKKLDEGPGGNSLIIGSRGGELATHGKWAGEPDGLRLAQPNADRGAFVRIVYEATQALAVLVPPAGKKTRFFVRLDDQWLYEGIAGRDVKIDDDGRSFVPVDSIRLYDLVRDSVGKPHVLFLVPETQGAGVDGFQFADACTATRLP